MREMKSERKGVGKGSGVSHGGWGQTREPLGRLPRAQGVPVAVALHVRHARSIRAAPTTPLTMHDQSYELTTPHEQHVFKKVILTIGILTAKTVRFIAISIMM